MRLPFPDAAEQEVLLRDLAARQQSVRTATEVFIHSIDLMTEYKQSLITAAVTGELDVTTAGSGIPG